MISYFVKKLCNNNLEYLELDKDENNMYEQIFNYNFSDNKFQNNTRFNSPRSNNAKLQDFGGGQPPQPKQFPFIKLDENE